MYTCNHLCLSWLFEELTQITIDVVDKALLDLLVTFARTPEERSNLK